MPPALSARSERPLMAADMAASQSPRGALYLMLQNRIYRGEIVHKGKSYFPAEGFYECRCRADLDMAYRDPTAWLTMQSAAN